MVFYKGTMDHDGQRSGILATITAGGWGNLSSSERRKGKENWEKLILALKKLTTYNW